MTEGVICAELLRFIDMLGTKYVGHAILGYKKIGEKPIQTNRIKIQ